MKSLKLTPFVIIGSLALTFCIVSMSKEGKAKGGASSPLSLAAPTMHDYETVEPSMHEFMEYMFEPGYKRLKPAMANSEPDRTTWKAIKGDSLVMAEGANLLLMREPDENEEAWQENASAVRKHGAELYEAAKSGDRDAAVKSYRAMIDNCNRCHKSHAEGEYQLEY